MRALQFRAFGEVGLADALKRKMTGGTTSASSPQPGSDQALERRSIARTRMGKKFITFPVSDEAEQQFDMLAVEMRRRREELMREALSICLPNTENRRLRDDQDPRDLRRCNRAVHRRTAPTQDGAGHFTEG